MGWGGFAIALFFLIGLVGGCAGSTTCSIKVFRFQLLFASVIAQIQRFYVPSGVFQPHYQNRAVSDEVISSVMAFFVLFMASLAGIAILLGLTGLDMLTAISGGLKRQIIKGKLSLKTRVWILCYCLATRLQKWILGKTMVNSKNNAPTADSFRISMLLYDTRYRSMTIQIIALVGVISALFWLGGNAFDNYFKEKPPICLSVVDKDQMAVSLIYSVFHSFGSGLASDIYGINFQNRGAGFNLTRGHPNEAGGGKRPMHTIIPAIARRAGRVGCWAD